MKALKAWNLLVKIIFLPVIIGTAFLFYKLISNPHEFWLYIESNKLFPRIIAWVSLLLGIYGIASRRFAVSTAVFLFAVAFFFAYIGRFIFKNMY